jgi:hypothetical protein
MLARLPVAEARRDRPGTKKGPAVIRRPPFHLQLRINQNLNMPVTPNSRGFVTFTRR